MLQEIIVASTRTPAVLSLEEAAGDYARASKSTSTRRAGDAPDVARIFLESVTEPWLCRRLDCRF